MYLCIMSECEYVCFCMDGCMYVCMYVGRVTWEVCLCIMSECEHVYMYVGMCARMYVWDVSLKRCVCA